MIARSDVTHLLAHRFNDACGFVAEDRGRQDD